jgi:hypothetical protein
MIVGFVCLARLSWIRFVGHLSVSPSDSAKLPNATPELVPILSVILSCSSLLLNVYGFFRLKCLRAIIKIIND